MTEHCINNGTSICQTKDATHLVVPYKDFRNNKTFGGTYSGELMELLFNFITDFESPDDRLTLCVTSISDKTWHILCYDDPFDNSSNCSLKALPAKETVELYSVRDCEFNKHDELIIYVEFGEENILLLKEDIEEEEMLRLYKCLKLSWEEDLFTDMTLQDVCHVHRAVIAATSNILDAAVSNLPLSEETAEDDNSTSTNITPVSNDKDVANCTKNTLNNKEVKLQELAANISAFAKYQNFSIKDETCFIQHLQDNVEEKSSVDNDNEEITFKNPDPEDYAMDLEGLTSVAAFQMMKYIYNGEVKYKFETLHELITAALLYKIDGYVNLLELELINIITDMNVIELHDIAKGFKLDKLRQETLQHIRSLDFVQNHAKRVQDPFIHKCILSTPSHKFKMYGIFTFTIPMISQLTKYYSENFYFGKCPISVSVKKNTFNDTAYFSIFVHTSGKYRVMTRYFINILRGTDDTKKPIASRSQSIIFGNKGRGFKKFISWSDLIDPSNCYVKDDSITIQVSMQVRDIWVD